MEHKRGEPLYTPEFNPHGTVRNSGQDNNEGTREWVCTYCKVQGTLDTLSKIACTEVHSPCTYCGCTPICAWDCKGVLGALNDPKVHIAGSHRGE